MEYLDDIDITEFNAIPTIKECICYEKRSLM
jgi:hypothetical protein